MLVNFNKIQEHTYSGMNKGTGTISAKMYMDKDCKIIPCTIHAGGSIGIHKHETSDDINYVLSGNGQEEILLPGVCHICRKNSEHSIINTGDNNLNLITVVIER